jgi:glutathione S-transferase
MPRSATAVSPATDPATPILFSDRGCPFAHRVLALLDHLNVAVERRESPIGAKPAGLERYSAAKSIPLLVHGELVLSESQVIAEYLSELHGFADAFPPELATRSRHRHAMALLDRTIVPALFGRKQLTLDDPQLADTLRALAQVATSTPPRPCLLTLHVAPMWQRVQWWQPHGIVECAVGAHPALRTSLDPTTELACVARTAPDRASHLADVDIARQAGLLDPVTT